MSFTEEISILKEVAMEQFDDILRENITKAFSSYNAEHLADEGWNSFVRAGKGRERRSLFVPLWARAASVLLIVGLAAYLSYRIFTRQSSRELISGNELPVVKVEEPKVQSETTRTLTPVIEPSSESLPVNENKAAVTGPVSTESIPLPEPLAIDNENILTQLSPENSVLVPEIVMSHYTPSVSAEQQKAPPLPADFSTASQASCWPDKNSPGNIFSKRNPQRVQIYHSDSPRPYRNN